MQEMRLNYPTNPLNQFPPPRLLPSGFTHLLPAIIDVDAKGFIIAHPGTHSSGPRHVRERLHQATHRYDGYLEKRAGAEGSLVRRDKLIPTWRVQGTGIFFGRARQRLRGSTRGRPLHPPPLSRLSVMPSIFPGDHLS